MFSFFPFSAIGLEMEREPQSLGLWGVFSMALGGARGPFGSNQMAFARNQDGSQFPEQLQTPVMND